ncbi:hypothetical protein B9Z55_008751 [Caenorhabditis nigoni]|uniref:Uncharacterized protein n=2 Tax=Caenorhabditis nigoni TaxID=1611254 RepID=A0A2G5UPV1_9PELO|nr:hypothetical protein B9Z55_008751 [Caenorhabditis nigoni]
MPSQPEMGLNQALFERLVLFMNHPLSGRQILATSVVFSALTADVIDGKLSSGSATSSNVGGAKKPLISPDEKEKKAHVK